MIQPDSLARLTLDTLPFSIAVLDGEGTILFTNTAWREFAGIGGERGEMVGTNYFASMDTADEDAARATAGLEAVIEGDREVFTLEYPCHSEHEKRWFLMRAAALPDHERGSVVVAHIDITERKLAEIRARERREELEHLMHRIDGLVHTVTEAVLQAESRSAVEATVCERLAAVADYAGAWVGRVDLRSDALVPAAVGDGLDIPEDAALDLAGDDPAVAALHTGEQRVVTVDADAAPVHAAAVGEGGGLAAFPLACNGSEYGVLVVYADSAAVFDELELSVLQVLAGFASTAINAIEGRRILAADRVIEMELSLAPEELFFGAVAAELDCTLEYEGTLYEDESEGVRMLFVAEGADPEAVGTVVEDRETVRGVSHVSEGEEGDVFEFTVDRAPVVTALAERGAETTAMTAAPGEVTVTLELPASGDPRTVVEHVSERHPSTELQARRERDQPDRTRGDVVDEVEAALTDRQELALRKAFLGGFFDWPREVSGEELAESMDISPSTYHQHLRTAERKVLAALFED